MLYQVLHRVVPPLAKAVWRPDVSGLEHVPASGPVLLASNHLSFADSLVIPIVVPRRVAEDETLYGSVSSNDIADLLKAKGFEVEERKLSLEEPIKTLGEHTIKIRLHPEVETTIRLLVTKEA